MPRLSEPGPLGMRAEHWYNFGTQAGDANLFSLVIAHIATATLPMQYSSTSAPTRSHRSPSPQEDRPLLMMSFLRKLALKAIIAAKKPSVMAAAGSLQHRVGCQDGANKMIKSIHYFAEADPTASWSLSISRLLSNMSPGAPCCSAWSSTTLNWPRSSPDGTRAPPRTACISAVRTRTSTPAAESIRARSHRADSQLPSNLSQDSSSRKTKNRLDGGAKLWAYLDDWNIWIKPRHIRAAIERISNATRTIHQELQAQQDPDLHSILPGPHPTGIPRQSQTNVEMLGRPLAHRRRQRRQLCGTGRATLHEYCHAPLPEEHLGHPAYSIKQVLRCRRSTTCSPCMWGQPASTRCA